MAAAACPAGRRGQSGEVVTMSTPLQSAPDGIGLDQRARDQARRPCARRRPAPRAGQAPRELTRPGCHRRSRWADRRADPGELNLAQPLADGQQLLIGTTGDPAGEVRDGRESGAGSGSASGDARSEPCQPGAAGGAAGVGPVTAGAILAGAAAWEVQSDRRAAGGGRHRAQDVRPDRATSGVRLGTAAGGGAHRIRRAHPWPVVDRQLAAPVTRLARRSAHGAAGGRGVGSRLGRNLGSGSRHCSSCGRVAVALVVAALRRSAWC